jgi:predicted signal transduction protein with EAL and GGDEF domain
MSFGMYLVGFIILIIGLAVGAHLMHVPPMWIGVGVLILIGLGIMMGVTTTRQRDPSS